MAVKPKKKFSEKVVFFHLKLYLGLVLLLFTVCGARIHTVEAQPADPPPANAPPAESNHVDYLELSRSLKKSYTDEYLEIDGLRKETLGLEQSENAADLELNTYQVQISTHNNLLLSPAATKEELEKAQSTHLETVYKVNQRLKELKEKNESINQNLIKTQERYSTIIEQLDKIKEQKASQPGLEALIKQLNTLAELLLKKKEIIQKLSASYEKRIKAFRDTSDALEKLTGQFEQQIEERTMKELFERQAEPLFQLSGPQIKEEWGLLYERIAVLVSKKHLDNRVSAVWQKSRNALIAYGVLYIVALFVLYRIKRIVLRFEKKRYVSENPWCLLALRLFANTLPLMGTVAVLYWLGDISTGYDPAPFILTTANVLLVLLFTRWALHFLTHVTASGCKCLSESQAGILCLVLVVAGLFASVHIVVGRLIGESSILCFMGRIGFGVFLIVMNYIIWRRLQISGANGAAAVVKKERHVLAGSVIMGAGYLIAAGGLVLDLTGYGQLALYWYTGWSKTAAVALWGALLSFFIRGWNGDSSGEKSDPDREEKETVIHPLRWFVSRICWILWIGSFVVSILLAWGASRPVFSGFFRALTYPIRFGEIRFSLIGFVYAFVILLIVHTTGRLWRSVLIKRIMAESGLEEGKQESIATISVYLIWAFGILAALYAMGISTTSLTVAFGALGIGLGFGLQNIFNNFVSGLILLFERPIQVGDAIELQGTWGTVKKINVRSTVVQTWDNASLIIPNSDFINNQLTNWSFKDTRLRRSINIGVAYGSDVQLVKDTLLEAANNHPDVYRYPKPDVLFLDFGDSSLLFRLRIWVTVDTILSTETDLRFEIDRMFRERNITIPFPQRDLHIKSMPKQDKQVDKEKIRANEQNEERPAGTGEE